MSMRKYGASSFKRPMTEEKEMSEVKTFDVAGTEFEVWENMSGDGEYVLYEDYAALKAEYDALATEKTTLR